MLEAEVTDKNKVYLAIAGLAIAGVLLMLVATRNGVGVPPDATVYFDAAHNLASGRGLTVISGTRVGVVPLTHYPPAFSSLLALLSEGGMTVETAARWLNASLFGVNIFLVGLSIAFCARDSFWLPVIGSLLALTAPDLLANHSVAMTEPLYLALTFGGLLVLGSYLQSRRRAPLLVAATLIAGSVLARYVGIATVGAGIIALLLLKGKESGSNWPAITLKWTSLRGRVFDAVVFIVVSCGPMALWSIRNRMATGGASDRQFAFHPIKVGQIVSALSTAAQWLLLGKVRLDVRLVGFIIEIVVLISLTIYILKKGKTSGADRAVQPTRLPQLLIIFLIVYVGLLIFTITFFERDNVLDGRSLLPAHVAVLVLLPYLAMTLYHRSAQSKSMRMLFVILALLLAGSYGLRGTLWLAQAQTDGSGYTSHAWKNSPTIARIRKLPPGILIYSNAVDGIYYLTGRRAFDIPAKTIHGTGQPNPMYDAELQRMRMDLSTNRGVMIYFTTVPERWYLPTESELKERLPLVVTFATADGSIWTVSSEANSSHQNVL